MANDCSNRLLIYCDNEHILEKIHDLFYQDEDGEIQYTMMKLVPIPADKYDDEGNARIGFFTPMGYWGTRSDFWSPKPTRRKNEFVLEYDTANGPNNYWIETLISSIMVALDEFSGATKPKLFIKHLFDVLQLQTAGYMYWEPGMAMKYDYSTEEEPNEKVISEFKAIEYELEREMEVFEHHIEDYLDEEPMKDEIILPRELDLTGIDWVVVGGESGINYRPCNKEWVIHLRDQCEAQGVQFTFKQWGGRFRKHNGSILQGRYYHEMPVSNQVRIFNSD